MALQAQIPFLPFTSVSTPVWYVTPENPVRQVEGLDFERCAALHNHIVEIGWVNSGRSLDDLERKNWFEYNGEEAEAVRHLLSPSLASFLDSAIDLDPNDHSFFYYVGGLNHPSQLFLNHEGSADPGEEHKLVTLYAANNMPSHPDGLVFNQETHEAIMQMSIHDSSTTQNGRQLWYQLEVVLTAWLNMIDIGKVKAVTSDYEVDNEKFDPWISLSYSDQILDETINAFNQLVETIHSHMPEADQLEQQVQETGLVGDTVLDSVNLADGFARRFLRRVLRPRFRSVAPGLQIPTDSTFPSQPFVAMSPDALPGAGEDSKIIPTILLFRSAQTFSADNIDEDRHPSDLPFGWPENQIRSFPAGLYLTATDREADHELEDEVRLVLPFGTGSKGFARTSDGARFGENTESKDVEPRDVYASLYQPGWQPFVEMHGVRLVAVLKSWRGMIERGDWEVDVNGVQGDLNAFNEADTEENWQKFVPPVSW